MTAGLKSCARGVPEFTLFLSTCAYPAPELAPTCAAAEKTQLLMTGSVWSPKWVRVALLLPSAHTHTHTSRSSPSPPGPEGSLMDVGATSCARLAP